MPDNDELPETYVEWNARLLDYCLEECDRFGGRFSLVVRQMLDDQEEEDAEHAFIETVRKTYQVLIRKTDDPLSLLSVRYDKHGRPLCGAFLGLAVRAAEEMDDLKYYAHLADLLQQKRTNSGVYGLSHLSFQDCWKALAQWVEKSGFAFPYPNAHEQRYIRWPKSHALLRRMDIEKLQAFFQQKKYSRLLSYSSDFIERDLKLWSQYFTKQGRKAFEDTLRRPGVIRQVLHALSQWNPSTPKSTHVHLTPPRPPAYAWLEWRDRGENSTLHFAALRRLGFPDCIRSELITWQAADDEWYESVEATDELLLKLHTGFETGQSYRLHFLGAPAFVLQPSEYGNCLDSRKTEGLPLGVSCGVLCRSSDQNRVASYLTRVCGHVVVPIEIRKTAPWVIFLRVKAIQAYSPPAGLEILSVATRLQVTFQGGLHTGKVRTWLDGAPPTSIEVTGLSVPTEFALNGEQFPLVAGKADIAALLASPGIYAFRVGDEIRRVTIEPVSVRQVPVPDAGEPTESLANDASPTCGNELPPGRWTMLGLRADEVSDSGTTPTFETQWLVGRDESGILGKVAIREVPEVARRMHISPLNTVARRWSDAVGAVERERLGTLADEAEPDRLFEIWRSYVEEARRLRGVRRSRLRAHWEAIDD